MYLLRIIFAFCIVFLIPGHYARGQYNKILEQEQKLHSSKADTVKVNLLEDLASQYFEYNLDRVNNYALQAKALSEQLHYKKGLGRSLVIIAGYQIRTSKFDLAGENLESAFGILQEANDTPYLIRVYNSLSAINLSLDQTAESTENEKKALNLARLSHDKKSEILMLKNICNSYVVNGDFNNGLAVGKQALLLARQLKSAKDSAYIYDDIGLSYIGLKQYDTGRAYLLQSLYLDEKLDLKRQAVICLTNIAESYAAQDNFNKALEYYQSSLNKASLLKDTQFVSMIRLSIGNVYDHLKQYDKAIFYFKQSVNGLIITRKYYSLGHAYEHLADVYAKTGDTKKAYEYEILFAGIKDSINTHSSLAGISALEYRYNVKRKQDEINLLKATQSLKESRISRQRLMLYALLGGGGLILFLIITLFNRARIKQRMKLMAHTAELEKKALQLQMNPHFIFNSLGAISGFISSNDTSAALKYLSKFSKLIRYTLESSAMATVPVNLELENLKNYLELEKMRFNHKFDYEINIPHELANSFRIPPMIIQPIIENAILHGITPKTDQGFIRISFFPEDDRVLCLIEDNGIGIGKPSEMIRDVNGRKSLGIEITSKRLNILNAGKIKTPSIRLENLADTNEHTSGTKVTIQFFPA